MLLLAFIDACLVSVSLISMRHHLSTSLAGIYGCHMVVLLEGQSTVRGTRAVTVSAKPTAAIYTSASGSESVPVRLDQYLSDDKVSLLCVVDGYPLTHPTWSFSQRKKKGLLSPVEHPFGK